MEVDLSGVYCCDRGLSPGRLDGHSKIVRLHEDASRWIGEDLLWYRPIGM